MADEEAQRPVEKIMEFIDELDDKFEAKLAEYTAEREFLPQELNDIIDTVDQSLDKIVDFLRPFAENRPIMTFIQKIKERIQARRAARQAQ